MRIRVDRAKEPLRHSWRWCFGQGNAEELLRSDVMRHIGEAKRRIGFSYLRFHGLFHDNLSVVSRRPDGRLTFHWSQVDRVLDGLLALGLRPFVELGPMPLAMASGPETIFRWEMNVTPPRSWDEWSELVAAFATHSVQRYGADEVRTWYFEVWNEPNLPGFWTGTQADYWRLYSTAARALKSVDAALRVGGPSTAQAQWIPEFIRHCADSAVPVDFVSTHSYLQDEALCEPCAVPTSDPSPYLLGQFERIQQQVAQSAMPDLEIHWTEWNALTAGPDGTVSWTENPCMDSRYAGTLALDHAVRADHLCDSLSWWVVSDVFTEDGISSLPYSSAYGLFSTLGTPKPPLHAFEWLSLMRGARLDVEDASAGPGHGVLATREGSCIRALLWHHAGPGADSPPWRGSFSVELDVPVVEVRRHLSANSGSGFEHWIRAGSPANLTKSQESTLRALSEPEASAGLQPAGLRTIEFELAPHDILFLEWAVAELPAARRGVHRASAAELEAKLAAASQ